MTHGKVVLPTRGSPDRFFVATPKYMVIGDDQYTLVTAMSEIIYEKKEWPADIQAQFKKSQGDER